MGRLFAAAHPAGAQSQRCPAEAHQRTGRVATSALSALAPRTSLPCARRLRRDGSDAQLERASHAVVRVHSAVPGASLPTGRASPASSSASPQLGSRISAVSASNGSSVSGGEMRGRMGAPGSSNGGGVVAQAAVGVISTQGQGLVQSSQPQQPSRAAGSSRSPSPSPSGPRAAAAVQEQPSPSALGVPGGSFPRGPVPAPLPAPIPDDVIQEFEHKLEADLQTVGVTITAILGVIIFWRGVWALLDHFIGDSVLGDLCCILVGLSIVLYIRLSGMKLASFWPPS